MKIVGQNLGTDDLHHYPPILVGRWYRHSTQFVSHGSEDTPRDILRIHEFNAVISCPFRCIKALPSSTYLVHHQLEVQSFPHGHSQFFPSFTPSTRKPTLSSKSPKCWVQSSYSLPPQRASPVSPRKLPPSRTFPADSQLRFLNGE